MFTLHDTVTSPSRIGLDMIAIQRGDPLDLDLRVESVSEGVLVSGTVTAPTVGECARCLTEVRSSVQVVLTELFAYPDSTTEATTEEDEVGHIVDDTFDLEQAIIDAVGLELPLSPVCRPDCPGLCAVCGIPLASEPGHGHDQIDPEMGQIGGYVHARTARARPVRGRAVTPPRQVCSTRSASSCPTSCCRWR